MMWERMFETFSCGFDGWTLPIESRVESRTQKEAMEGVVKAA